MPKAVNVSMQQRAPCVSFCVKASGGCEALGHGVSPRNRVYFGLFLGTFRRITAAASRLLTDGADGSFYGLESLNAWVRSMVPTHPALVLLWCQILLLVSHTDYRWWAEVQQTPRYARSAPREASPGSWVGARSSLSSGSLFTRLCKDSAAC